MAKQEMMLALAQSTQMENFKNHFWRRVKSNQLQDLLETPGFCCFTIVV